MLCLCSLAKLVLHGILQTNQRKIILVIKISAEENRPHHSCNWDHQLVRWNQHNPVQHCYYEEEKMVESSAFLHQFTTKVPDVFRPADFVVQDWDRKLKGQIKNRLAKLHFSQMSSQQILLLLQVYWPISSLYSFSLCLLSLISTGGCRKTKWKCVESEFFVRSVTHTGSRERPEQRNSDLCVCGLSADWALWLQAGHFTICGC